MEIAPRPFLAWSWVLSENGSNGGRAATRLVPIPCLRASAVANSVAGAVPHRIVGKVASALAGCLLGLKRVRQQRQVGRKHQTVRLSSSSCGSANILQLQHLGGTPFEKALSVNLDMGFYGSFAEIGAGQEVSRQFLQAGAAASTVGRSVSAYDMQMSDGLYGQAKRYVTQERCLQMMNTEYDLLEKYVRETRGPDVRFFSFATTLAARAFRSTRECEGWVGITFQDKVGANAKSTVCLHVRMSDPDALQQGQAIGVLGTNLVYLCHGSSDPYIISSFLLDGIEPGRLEVDYISFSGPAFPEGSVDSRLLAMRMVQFKVADAVLLEYNEATGRYGQSVPNTALYKRPTVVTRSYFRPVVKIHKEVLAASARKLAYEGGADAKPTVGMLNMIIDDVVRPEAMVKTKARMDLIRKMIELDANGNGSLERDELKTVLPEEDVDRLFLALDSKKLGSIPIDSLTSLDRSSVLAEEFLDRFNMLEPLRSPVLVSGIQQMHILAEYLRRYTNQSIVFAIGGNADTVESMLFDRSKYEGVQGGMLNSLGRLCENNVRVFAHPYVKSDGTTAPPEAPSGNAGILHQYLTQEGLLVPIEENFISPDCLDASRNEGLRGGSSECVASIKAGTSEWESLVPEEVAKIMKRRDWFQKLADGQKLSASEVFDILKRL